MQRSSDFGGKKGNVLAQKMNLEGSLFLEAYRIVPLSYILQFKVRTMRQSISAFSRRILDAIVNGCICAIANLQGTRSTLPQGRTIGPACRVVPWLLVLLPPTFGHAQLHDKAEFFQTCDASAGISLDERLFAVASDEDNWIRIYDYKSPGNPTQLVNFSSLVGISTDEEADVEAATQIGDVTYWITSHGTNSHGERKSSRQILFALRFAVLQNKIEYSIVGVKGLGTDAIFFDEALLDVLQREFRKLTGLRVPGMLLASIIETKRKAGEWLRLRDFQSGGGFDDLDKIANM